MKGDLSLSHKPPSRPRCPKEAAHLQGFGPKELHDYGLGDIPASDLQNLVGNAFSTTVISAVILGALLAWQRY